MERIGKILDREVMPDLLKSQYTVQDWLNRELIWIKVFTNQYAAFKAAKKRFQLLHPGPRRVEVFRRGKLLRKWTGGKN